LQLAAHQGHQIGVQRKLKQMALEATMGLSWRVLNGKEGAKRRVASEWLQNHCRELQNHHNDARAKEKQALQSLVQAAARRRRYARLAARLEQASAFAWFCAGQEDLWPPAWWKALAPGTEGGLALEAEIDALAEADRVILELPNRLARKPFRSMPQSPMVLYSQPNQGSDDKDHVLSLMPEAEKDEVKEVETPLWWRRRAKLQAAKAQAAEAKARAQAKSAKSHSTLNSASSGDDMDAINGIDDSNVVAIKPSLESHDVGSTGFCSLLVDGAFPGISLDRFDRDHQRSFASAVAVVLNVCLHQFFFNDVRTEQDKSLVVAVQAVGLPNETKAAWKVVKRAPLVLEKGLTSAGLGACTALSSPTVQAWDGASQVLDAPFAAFKGEDEKDAKASDLVHGQKLEQSDPIKADKNGSPSIQQSLPSQSAIIDNLKQSHQDIEVEQNSMTETRNLASDHNHKKLEIKTIVDMSNKAARSMSPAERRKSLGQDALQRKKAEDLRIKALKRQGEREAEEMMEILAACQARTVEVTQETLATDNVEQVHASKVETPRKMNRKQVHEEKKKELAEQEATRMKGEMLRLKTLQLQMSRDAEEMAAVLAITQARSRENALEAGENLMQGAVSDSEADSLIEDSSSSLLTVLNSFDSIGNADDVNTKRKKAIIKEKYEGCRQQREERVLGRMQFDVRKRKTFASKL